MRRVLAVSAALLAGCEAGTEPESGPARVVVVSVSPAVERWDHDRWEVPMSLRNEGGPGAFRVQFWRLPISPNTSTVLCAESDVLSVQEGWAESVTWAFYCDTSPRYAIVLTRPDDSVVFERTDSVDIETN